MWQRVDLQFKLDLATTAEMMIGKVKTLNSRTININISFFRCNATQIEGDSRQAYAFVTQKVETLNVVRSHVYVHSGPEPNKSFSRRQTPSLTPVFRVVISSLNVATRAITKIDRDLRNKVRVIEISFLTNLETNNTGSCWYVQDLRGKRPCLIERNRSYQIPASARS